MTEKYFSASFGRFESFFIAYHVELSLLGQQTLVRRILILSFFSSLFISRIKFQPPRFHQHFFSGYFRWAQHGRGYTVGMSCGSQPLHPVSKKTRRVGRGSVWRRTLKVSKELRWNLNVLEWREWALFNGRWMFESKRNPESEGL